MLKTLDPILITIIAMSAVGVLLGAVCGVLFYCACAHTSNRNLSALENYNFELVDGVKLQKEKLSAQKSYTEAWEMRGESLNHFRGTFWERHCRLRAFYSQDVRGPASRGRSMYRLYSQMIVYLFVCLFVHLLLVMRPRQKYVSSHTVSSFFYETPFLRGTAVHNWIFSVIVLLSVYVCSAHTSFQWCL